MTTFVLPSQMPEGHLKWEKEEGDFFKEKDILVRIKSLKNPQVWEVEAPFDGRLAQIFKPSGGLVAGSALIADLARIESSSFPSDATARTLASSAPAAGAMGGHPSQGNPPSELQRLEEGLRSPWEAVPAGEGWKDPLPADPDYPLTDDPSGSFPSEADRTTYPTRDIPDRAAAREGPSELQRLEEGLRSPWEAPATEATDTKEKEKEKEALFFPAAALPEPAAALSVDLPPDPPKTPPPFAETEGEDFRNFKISTPWENEKEDSFRQEDIAAYTASREGLSDKTAMPDGANRPPAHTPIDSNRPAGAEEKRGPRDETATASPPRPVKPKPFASSTDDLSAQKTEEAKKPAAAPFIREGLVEAYPSTASGQSAPKAQNFPQPPHEPLKSFFDSVCLHSLQKEGTDFQKNISAGVLLGAAMAAREMAAAQRPKIFLKSAEGTFLPLDGDLPSSFAALREKLSAAHPQAVGTLTEQRSLAVEDQSFLGIRFSTETFWDPPFGQLVYYCPFEQVSFINKNLTSVPYAYIRLSFQETPLQEASAMISYFKDIKNRLEGSWESYF